MSGSDKRFVTAKGFMETKQYEDARAIFSELIAEGIELVSSVLCYGVSLMHENRIAEAAEFFDKHAEAATEVLLNLSVCYSKLGEPDKEAEVLYRMVRKTHEPRYENPFRKLAAWAHDKKQFHIEHEALMALFDINPDDPSILIPLAHACKALNKPTHAVTFCHKLLALLPDSSSAEGVHALLAGLYKDAAMQREALQHYRKSYALSKTAPSASNLIMDMQYSHGVDFSEFYNQCREYSARFLRGLPRFSYEPDFLKLTKATTGLRIGFSSGDFIAHSLANLLLEPFKRLKEIAPHHSLYIYSDREEEKEDGISAQYREACDVWRCIRSVPDAEAANIIHNDKIDILVEIAGHTAYNRLPVFGYKPAPVQVGWVSGMMTPPGIDTINYFLTDQWIRPPCADKVCFEKLYNLPAAYCYFPLANAPAIGELPALKRGYITFGSFNNPCKLSSDVLLTWAEVLRELPSSRLKVKVYSLATERYIQRTMGGFGVSPDRVEGVYNFPRTEDLMAYYSREIDIALDTWPCAGCLTSAEAMWMGCPVITLYGDTFLHRQTWTILNQIGLKELGSDTHAGFVKAAVDLAKDTNKLSQIRNSLRRKMENAPIRDPMGMAKGILESLEHAWVDWCNSRASLQEALA